HGVVRERGGHADPVAGDERHARRGGDRRARTGDRRRRGGAAGPHAVAHLRSPPAGRRRRRPRPHPPGRPFALGPGPARLAAMKIASLLPSATEIVYALGLGDDLVGVTDECDYPPEAVTKPVISRSALPQGRIQTPREIDDAVRAKVGRDGQLYIL